jgi:hypothetical protein
VTYVDFLNFGKKRTLLEVLKDKLGGGKKREKYVVMGLRKRCPCP